MPSPPISPKSCNRQISVLQNVTISSGKIGINLAASWYQPKKSTDPEVGDAVERAFQFELGWFAEPILLTGDYPDVMKRQIENKSKVQKVPNRLPGFSGKEKAMVKGKGAEERYFIRLDLILNTTSH